MYFRTSTGNVRAVKQMPIFKEVKEGITPRSMRSVALWGQGPWALAAGPSRKGPITVSQVEAGRTGGTGAAPALGTPLGTGGARLGSAVASGGRGCHSPGAEGGFWTLTKLEKLWGRGSRPSSGLRAPVVLLE